jgi:hypothetical protein
VTVEWGCVAENGVDSCGWGHSFHFVGEGFEFGAVASGTCLLACNASRTRTIR